MWLPTPVKVAKEKDIQLHNLQIYGEAWFPGATFVSTINNKSPKTNCCTKLQSFLVLLFLLLVFSLLMSYIVTKSHTYSFASIPFISNFQFKYF